jgi:triphosphoribosyl-dephospho-CoA synthase
MAPLLLADRPPDIRNSRERSCQLASLARQALIAEAELTPKPGLVDRRGSGAHHDLSLDLMLRSATVLEPYFADMASAAEGRVPDRDLRAELAAIGRDAEREMYNATEGANSHKGAIWILGLLVAAAAQRDDLSAEEIASAAGVIARFPDRASLNIVTHGDIVRNRYGVAGARGEACHGFPHVVRFGLPTLHRQRKAGFAEEVCRLDALFSIMSRLEDTCLLYRGGIEALNFAKARARTVLLAGGYGSSQGRMEACSLDRGLIARGISPGGSADLLAAAIFLDVVEREQHEVCKDESEWEWEVTDGKAGI